jgi:hypothetical protein
MKACLFEDRCGCFGMQVVAGFAGHRDGAAFRVVLELAVTAALFDKSPSVVAQQPRNFAYIHIIAKRLVILYLGQPAASPQPNQ